MLLNDEPQVKRAIKGQGPWWKSPPFVLFEIGLLLWSILPLLLWPRLLICCLFIQFGAMGAAILRWMQVNSYDYKSRYGLLSDDPAVLEDAIETFTESIEAHPKQVEAYLVRAVAYLRLNRLDEALGDINLVIARQPNIWAHYNIRGLIQKGMGRYEAALRDMNMAIQLNPKNWEVYANRGQLCTIMGDFATAIDDLNWVLDKNPKNPDLWQNLALLSLHRGDTREALSHVDHLQKLRRHSWTARDLRGEIYLVRGELDAALENLLEAQRMRPDAPGVLLRLIVAYLMRDQPDAAQATYELLRNDHPTIADPAYLTSRRLMHPTLQKILTDYVTSRDHPTND